MPERIKYIFVFEDHFNEHFFNFDEEALAYQQKFYPDTQSILIMDESRKVIKPGKFAGTDETLGIP